MSSNLDCTPGWQQHLPNNRPWNISQTLPQPVELEPKKCNIISQHMMHARLQLPKRVKKVEPAASISVASSFRRARSRAPASVGKWTRVSCIAWAMPGCVLPTQTNGAPGRRDGIGGHTETGEITWLSHKTVRIRRRHKKALHCLTADRKRIVVA